MHPLPEAESLLGTRPWNLSHNLASCHLRPLPARRGVPCLVQGPEVMRMYEEHAMSAIYMDAEMSHHGDPGNPDSTESYHPGLVVEQLNKVRHILLRHILIICASQAGSYASLHEQRKPLFWQLQLRVCAPKLVLTCS